ncbi:MAG: response regulator [Boseongicola sp.]|nr:MAG: response regulator [Boseongicola sp.]
MPETLEDFLMARPPTAERPLLGQTVLMVEDSRFACEALRMICQRSGARIRRADTLKNANRHLRTYRPGIVLIDVGLPDGSGLGLIETLAKSDPPIGVIIAMSGDDTLADATVAAGANVFMPKPITSISAFQQMVLAELPKYAQPLGLRAVASDEVVPDRIALRDDLALAADLLTGTPDEETVDYAINFLIGLAKSAGDDPLSDALHNFETTRQVNLRIPEALADLRHVIELRLEHEIAV